MMCRAYGNSISPPSLPGCCLPPQQPFTDPAFAPAKLNWRSCACTATPSHLSPHTLCICIMLSMPTIEMQVDGKPLLCLLDSGAWIICPCLLGLLLFNMLMISSSPSVEQCFTDTVSLIKYLAAEEHKANLSKCQFLQTSITFL